MRLFRLAASGCLSVLIAACSGGPSSDAALEQHERAAVEIQLLSVSDWHGQLEALSIPGTGNVGGAAVLSAYFQADRRANPATLTLTAGDGFGASPPLASFFEEKPAVLGLNALKFDADGIGNHNFDKGTEHFGQMADLAEYPYLSANLRNVYENVKCSAEKAPCIRPYVVKNVQGVKVALIGITNPDAQTLLAPGAMGTMEVGDPVAATEAARAQAAKEGAQVFVVLAHMGATSATPEGEPLGPIVDYAKAIHGIDVVLADHTNMKVNKVIGDALVVENLSQGATYARVKVNVAPKGGVISKSAEIITPKAEGMTPDPAISELLKPFQDKLSVEFDARVATSAGVFERGNNVERLREVPLGDLVADSVRVKYGVQAVLINGGGLRAPIPSSYNPADHDLRRPNEGYKNLLPYDVVVGDAYAVLPFGNSVVTKSVSGAQIWKALEHGVEKLPDAVGSFPQIAGIKVTFDSRKPAGARVLTVALADGTPVANDDATKLSLGTSDFMASGGDGYTMLVGTDGTTRDKMADVLLEHIKSLRALTPAVDGRLKDVAAP